MLPRMPNELQLIPLKLKCKLEYKSYYMFDVIQKDSIIGALTWLKTHNNFYKDIPINYNWYSTVPDDDIPEMLICQQDVHDREKNQFNNQQLQNNVLSKIIISVTHVKIKLLMMLYNIHHMTTVQLLIITVI